MTKMLRRIVPLEEPSTEKKRALPHDLAVREECSSELKHDVYYVKSNVL